MSRVKPKNLPMLTRSKKAKREQNQLGEVQVQNIHPINHVIPTPVMIILLNHYFNDVQKMSLAATCIMWFNLVKITKLLYLKGYRNFYEHLFKDESKMAEICNVEIDTARIRSRDIQNCEWFLTNVSKNGNHAKTQHITIQIQNRLLFNFLLRIKFIPQPKVSIQISRSPILRLDFDSRKVITLKFKNSELFTSFQNLIQERRNLADCMHSIEFESTKFITPETALNRNFLVNCRNLKKLTIKFTQALLDLATKRGYTDFIYFGKILINQNPNAKINIEYNENIVMAIRSAYPDLICNFVSWITNTTRLNKLKYSFGRNSLLHFPIINELKNTRKLILQGANQSITALALGSLLENDNIQDLKKLNLDCYQQIDASIQRFFQRKLVSILIKNTNIESMTLKNISLEENFISSIEKAGISVNITH